MIIFLVGASTSYDCTTYSLGEKVQVQDVRIVLEVCASQVDIMEKNCLVNGSASTGDMNVKLT